MLKKDKPKLVNGIAEEDDDAMQGKIYKIVVIGAGGVGFVSDTWQDTYDPTLEDAYRKHAKLNDEDIIYDIFDTAGQEEFSAIRDQYMRTADGFLCIYDITRISSLKVANNLYQLAVQFRDGQKFPFVLVGNKCDLSEEREVPTADGQKLANKLGCPFFEVSAKTNENVTAAFEKLAQLIYDARHKGTNSNTNNKKSKRK